jgi:predicted ribosomally synthesized peptide with SipW-like signal peptide
MVAIWYLLIVSIGLLSTNTVAYYSDNRETNGSVTIGTWEDEENVQQSTAEETVIETKIIKDEDPKIRTEDNQIIHIEEEGDE